MTAGPSLASESLKTGNRMLACVIVGWSLVWYVAYSWATVARLGLLERPAVVAMAVTLLAGLWMLGLRFPLGTSLLLLVSLPLFGNRPGGRLMEIVNLPLAAAAAGLALHATMRGLPRPSGPMWIAAALYVVSAIIALVPSIPGVMVRAAMLNHWPTALAEGLTASEDDPLYVLSSIAGLTLCAAWATALTWRAPGEGFFVRAVRLMVYVLFLVVAAGILDYHGAISIAPYFRLIDPGRPDLSGFQSIFWNPGWFAWYFVAIVGLAIGYLWTARPRERTIVAALLAICYGYFFTNPQRGGLVALHACLALAGIIFLRGRGRGQRAWRLAPLGALVLVLAVMWAYTFEYIPQTLGSSLHRLVASPDEVRTSNSVRRKLWEVSLQMWRDAPVFGAGEGSFAWRFEEYAAPGSALYTPVHGDAHNTWLQILATRGLVGLLAWVALVCVMGRALHAAWRRDRAERGLVIALSLSLTGFLVYSTVQAMFYLHAMQILFWFIVAGSASTREAKWAAARPAWVRGAAAAMLGAALIAQTAIARPLYARAHATIVRQPRGFYPVETSDADRTSWRWSAGTGTLCLQPRGPYVRVQMMTADPRPTAYPRTITVRINDAVVDSFRVSSPAVVTRVLPLPSGPVRTATTHPFGECAGDSGDVRLTVEVDRTWTPLSAGVGDDSRRLGVAVFEPSYPPG